MRIARLPPRRRRHAVPLATLLAVLATLLAPTHSSAAKREQRQAPSDPSGLMIVTPGRVEMDVEPGVPTTAEIEVYNDSEDVLDITIASSDLGQSSNPRSVATKVEDGEFGAGDWLDSEVDDARLQPFEAIIFTVTITPPLTAPTGSNFAGVVVKGAPGVGKVGATDGGGFVATEVLVQAFFTVPGPVDHDLRIVDIDARDTFVLGSRRFVIWEVLFENRGTVNEHVSGSLNVRSIFGNSAHREKIDDLLVLRGAKRSVRVVWSELPWVGAFTPEVRVRGDNAKLVERSGERVVLMPIWLPILIALMFIVPTFWVWWRRRQDWKHFMEDEEDNDWDDPDLVNDY